MLGSLCVMLIAVMSLLGMLSWWNSSLDRALLLIYITVLGACCPAVTAGSINVHD